MPWLRTRRAMPTRRGKVVVAAIVAALALPLAPPGAAAQTRGDGFPIYGRDKWLGSVNQTEHPLFPELFNQVTPENAGKWGSAAGTTRTAPMRWTR